MSPCEPHRLLQGREKSSSPILLFLFSAGLCSNLASSSWNLTKANNQAPQWWPLICLQDPISPLRLHGVAKHWGSDPPGRNLPVSSWCSSMDPPLYSSLLDSICRNFLRTLSWLQPLWHESPTMPTVPHSLGHVPQGSCSIFSQATVMHSPTFLWLPSFK